MDIVSTFADERINSTNLLVEMSIDEYTRIASHVLDKNEFQRKRVRSSKTIYSLLKKDLQIGCVIPPLVLALNRDVSAQDDAGETLLETQKNEPDSFVILDGLQRTYTMLDIIDELTEAGDQKALAAFKNRLLRVEVYIGINRLGILYRMLTLNTGQTPMSLRQQIEILYLDYVAADVDDIELIKEADNRVAAQRNQFNFKDTVEGFNSYIERSELPIGRADILENVQSLEKLADENAQADLFEEYLRSVNAVLRRMFELCQDAEVSEDYIARYGVPFGKNVQQIFKRPQALSGYGAAAGRLKDFALIDGFEELYEMASQLRLEESPVEFIERFNEKLSEIKSQSKKIGNAQRMFFQYFYREAFNKEGDSYLNLYQSIDTAYQKYLSQTV
ncbi:MULTISPECIES: hypothetical protein [unclassified Wenzhouxiangella]|uniref:hypothetical protein n=1 Tax=unclassified Wenzhouxiangella TaxID=2613841 RepID=UPI000E329CD9|nr:MULTISPECIES: hypothetical protein [unclassified Wenzhouxiangella]RFF28551.1 hypothetical protein DZK25_03180 [Wenzhouxiangella sp. 15181]RFP70070.1 hypothetical protein DZK26_02280 [Wenzhouxiangella sp. 15190]